MKPVACRERTAVPNRQNTSADDRIPHPPPRRAQQRGIAVRRMQERVAASDGQGGFRQIPFSLRPFEKVGVQKERRSRTAKPAITGATRDDVRVLRYSSYAWE